MQWTVWSSLGELLGGGRGGGVGDSAACHSTGEPGMGDREERGVSMHS